MYTKYLIRKSVSNQQSILIIIIIIVEPKIYCHQILIITNTNILISDALLWFSY